jgi:light-independent protochlorophyllide reductase subunit B
MQLTLWTYEGPPHVGAMRVATALTDVHYVLHAPQGDTYADLLFTMIERLPRRPPVTYTTFQARDLGGDTAELFKTAAAEAYARFQPAAMLVGASCTAELIQDDPGGLAKALALPVPVVPLELPSYQRKENWGAAETFYQLVRTLAGPAASQRAASEATAPGSTRPQRPDGQRPRCNLLGPTALGFRHRDDVKEIRGLLGDLGIEVAVVAPLGASAADVARLGEADFNVVLYPETAQTAANWLQRQFGQPFTRTVPIGVAATREFIAEVRRLAGLDVDAPLPPAVAAAERSTWYARSVDSTYLTGKRVFVFGDATHAVAAARVAQREFGFQVVGLGTYSREFAREIREAAKLYDIEPLICDDYLEVEAAVAELQPELVLGTQMERHIAKRLGVPCAVISAPVHVQDFPARHSPQMGFEGANVLFDTWVHPLMMGLEEHLLTMFRGDFEFHDGAAASHLGRSGGQTAPRAAAPQPGEAHALPAAAPGLTSAPARTGADAAAANDAAATLPDAAAMAAAPVAAPSVAGNVIHVATWAPDAQKELQKIPFFVRGKARRNTERFAAERGLATITLDTLYDAKAHFGR